MNLIEKLEQEVKKLKEIQAEEKVGSLKHTILCYQIIATVRAINIVKQHEVTA